MKQPCVYIMASRRHGTLYTGVTANLPRRAFEHREELLKGGEIWLQEIGLVRGSRDHD